MVQQRRWIRVVETPGGSARDWHTTADGTRLHVRESGPAEAAETLVLVHGWSQHSGCWDGTVARLPDDVRVLRLDLRGHGASDPARPGTRTLEQLADDLAEVLTARTGGPVVVAGHSMGGMTLMALAERHPGLVSDRLAGVGFVATSAGDMHRISFGIQGPVGRAVPRGQPALRALLELRKKDTLPGNPRLLSPFGRWLVFGQNPPPHLVEETVREALAAHPASVGGFLDAIFAHDRRRALSLFAEVPTLVLAGASDRFCPADHSRVIAGELPGSRLIVYPGAGHMLMHERATDVAQRLAELVRVSARQ